MPRRPQAHPDTKTLKVAAFIVAGICACQKHEDAAPQPIATTAESTTAAPNATAIGSAEIREMVALLHSAAVAETEPDAGQGTSYGHVGKNMHVPTIRPGTVTVRGRLPPEVVRRVVRRSFAKFRFCYENGLQTDSNLAGTIATQFVIDPKGIVTTTMRDASTTLKDASVVSCVTKSFADLSFPAPEGGIVLVTYALVFAPSD